MKPRLIFRRGMWICVGWGAWGAGYTLLEAWMSWRNDRRAV